MSPDLSSYVTLMVTILPTNLFVLINSLSQVFYQKLLWTTALKHFAKFKGKNMGRSLIFSKFTGCKAFKIMRKIPRSRRFP